MGRERRTLWKEIVGCSVAMVPCAGCLRITERFEMSFIHWPVINSVDPYLKG